MNFDSQILCQLARYRLLTRKAVTSGRMATDERSLLSDRLKYLEASECSPGIFDVEGLQHDGICWSVS